MLKILAFVLFFVDLLFGDFLLRKEQKYLELELIKGKKQKQFFLQKIQTDEILPQNLYTVFYDEINRVRKITRQSPSNLKIILNRKGNIFSITESDSFMEEVTFFFHPLQQQIIKFHKKHGEDFYEIQYSYNQKNQLTNTVYFINNTPYRNIVVDYKEDFLEEKVFQHGVFIEKSIRYPVQKNKNRVFVFDSQNTLKSAIIQHWQGDYLVKSQHNNLFEVDYYFFPNDESLQENTLEENITNISQDKLQQNLETNLITNLANSLTINLTNKVKKTNHNLIQQNNSTNQVISKVKKFKQATKQLLTRKSIDGIYQLSQKNYLISVWKDKKNNNQKIVEYYYENKEHFFTSKILEYRKKLLKNSYLENQKNNFINIEPFNFYTIYPKIEIIQSKKNNSFSILEEDSFIQKHSIFSNNLLRKEKIVSKKNNFTMLYLYKYHQKNHQQKKQKDIDLFSFVIDDEEIINKKKFYFDRRQKKVNLFLLKNILFYLNDFTNDTISIANLLNDNFELMQGLSKIDFLFNQQQDKSITFNQQKNKIIISLSDRNNKLLNQYTLYFRDRKFQIIRINHLNNIFILDLINNKNISIPYLEENYLKNTFKNFNE